MDQKEESKKESQDSTNSQANPNQENLNQNPAQQNSQNTKQPAEKSEKKSFKNPFKKETQEDVTAKLAKANDELLADLQRTRADFENFRKQQEIQKENAKKIVTESTVMKFLPLIDDMERAINANPETLKPVEKTLEKLMKNLNLEKIDAKPGTEFNPEIHNAISVDEESEGDKEVVAEELMSGYRYEGELIRPAMVRVKHVK